MNGSTGPTYVLKPGTVASRIVGYLETQPQGVELNSSQIAEALNIDGPTVIACLEAPLRAGLIFRRQKVPRARAPWWWSLVDHEAERAKRAPLPPATGKDDEAWGVDSMDLAQGRTSAVTANPPAPPLITKPVTKRAEIEPGLLKSMRKEFERAVTTPPKAVSAALRLEITLDTGETILLPPDVTAMVRRAFAEVAQVPGELRPRSCKGDPCLAEATVQEVAEAVARRAASFEGGGR